MDRRKANRCGQRIDKCLHNTISSLKSTTALSNIYENRVIIENFIRRLGDICGPQILNFSTFLAINSLFFKVLIIKSINNTFYLPIIDTIDVL